jgi:RNA polymerase sigma-70 factor (ECF subfamily)
MTNRADTPFANAGQRDEQLRALLVACAKRDRRAFEDLYRHTSAKLYGVLLRILDRPEVAQECLQEVYLKIWNKAEEYNPYVAAPMTWMSSIARYQAIDLLRRRPRERSAADPHRQGERIDPGGSPEQLTASHAQGQRLDKCLRQLKSEQRQVMVLAFFKGLTHDELAQRTLLPVGTIKTWIRRGLHQLRSCIEI